MNNKLPSYFKFTYKDHPTKYSASVLENADSVFVTRDNGENERVYSQQSVEKFLQSGVWIIIEDKISSEPMKELDNSNTILQEIKEFTNTGHNVFIVNSEYFVCRKFEDIPYVCKDDETLLKVMRALIMLDELVQKEVRCE